MRNCNQPTDSFLRNNNMFFWRRITFIVEPKRKYIKKKKNGFYCRRRLRFIVGGFQNDDHVATTEIGNSVPHLRRNENAHKPITLPVIRHKAEKTVFFFREVEENREERIKLKGHCGYSIHPVFMIVSTGWRRLVSSSIMLWSCDRSIDWFLLAIRKYDLRSLEWSKSIQNINFMREHAAFNVLNQVHSMKCAFFNFHYLLLYLCLEFRLRWPSENILKYCIKRLWTSCSCMYRNICEDLLLVSVFVVNSLQYTSST